MSRGEHVSSSNDRACTADVVSVRHKEDNKWQRVIPRNKSFDYAGSKTIIVSFGWMVIIVCFVSRVIVV
uniref:Neur_chan_memb domain-containing protein n=1 Tax=Panagrellus redivivus TaxID=6233 RepID=A0A7E4USW5_PANRE